MAAFLLDVTPEALSYALCNRLMEAGSGSHRATVYHVPLNAVQANAARNALAQSIYGRLFDWIIDRTNRALQCHHAQTVVKSVGILDIYGFEIFDQNHFEQLCVNYVNEKLQQIFVQLTLKSEQVSLWTLYIVTLDTFLEIYTGRVRGRRNPLESH